MLLIILLAIIALILVTIVLAGIGIGGAAFIVVFADVIVCVVFIIWLIKKLTH